MFTSLRAYYPLVLFLCLHCSARANGVVGFRQNKGQVHDQFGRVNQEVLFLASSAGLNVQLRKTGYSYELIQAENVPSLKAGQKFIEPSGFMQTRILTNRIDVDFVGADPEALVTSSDISAGEENYYISGTTITGVHTFRKVTFHEIYPGTDIEFIADEQTNAIKYNIILHKGADISRLKFIVNGAEVIQLGSRELLFRTDLGAVMENIPLSYYTDSPGENVEVRQTVAGRSISFSSDHDNKRELIIDPSCNRIWGTYYGGSSLDYATAAGTDPLNNVYMGGYTLSTSGIATTGVYQNTLSGSYDMFLARFDVNGNRTWCSYFGGSSFDIAWGMYVSPNGAIYLCGDTFSTSGVTSASSHQPSYGGGIDDALLVKFDSAGQLSWSTYYGGTLHDIAIAVTEDAGGNVILSGHTESSTAMATPGSYNDIFYGGFDVFIAKFSSAGVRQWGTYYGELDLEEAFAATCDASGNIYITGFTTSSNNIATASGYQTSNAGLQDAFLAKFNPGGTTLLYGTYYGGPGIDQGTGIALSSIGDIFLTGNTSSLTGISSPGAWQTAAGSGDDTFIARFNASGARQWCTYFGGEDTDYLAGIILDGNNNLVVCGSTMSTTNIATPGAFQTTIGVINNYDACFARFDPGGTRELASYYGGSGGDHGRGITMDGFGKIYICGETSSNDSIASPGAFSTSRAGGDDAFLARFCLAPEPVIFPAGPSTICKGDTIMLSTDAGFVSYLWSDGSTGNPIFTSDTLIDSTYYFTVTVYDGTGCDATSDTATVIVDLCASLVDNAGDAVRIYPVPANDFLMLEMTGVQNADAFVYSASGQIVLQETVTDPVYKLDIKKLSPGIYVLQVRVNGSLHQQRFMKE